MCAANSDVFDVAVLPQINTSASVCLCAVDLSQYEIRDIMACVYACIRRIVPSMRTFT